MAEPLHQSCPLITSHHRLLKVHRYRHHTRTKKPSHHIQGLFATFSSAPFKALGRRHVLHSASILLERLLMLISFSKEKANSTKMSGKINKELTMNPDKTEVTLLMKENASQDWVRCRPLQVQAFFSSTMQSTKDSARPILRPDVEDLRALPSLANTSHLFLQRKT